MSALEMARANYATAVRALEQAQKNLCVTARILGQLEGRMISELPAAEKGTGCTKVAVNGAPFNIADRLHDRSRETAA